MSYTLNESEDGEEERDIIAQDEMEDPSSEPLPITNSFQAIEDVTDLPAAELSLGARPSNASLTFILVSTSIS